MNIVIRDVYGKVDKKYFINPCPHPRTGKLPDCVKPVNAVGDMILSEADVSDMSSGKKFFIAANEVIIVEDGTTFDLLDVVDKAKWEAIQYCSWIAKDRFERDSEGNLVVDGNAYKYGNAMLYVERPGEISQARVTKKQLVHRACSYIYEDSESNKIRKCKVLGRDFSNALPVDITDYMIDRAEKNPQEIINLYEGEDWRIQLFIIEALERGVIRNISGMYTYQDKNLGASMNATIEFMKDFRYKALIDSIKKETYPNLSTKEDIDVMKSNMYNNLPGSTNEDDDSISLDGFNLSDDKKTKPKKIIAK